MHGKSMLGHHAVWKDCGEPMIAMRTLAGDNDKFEDGV